MRLLRRAALAAALLGCLVGASVSAAGATAAMTTRFVSLNGAATPSQCNDVTSPCALLVALSSVQAGDTLSLAGGTYDLDRVALPPLPLRWTSTDIHMTAVLTSASAAPTVSLTAAQSGSSFDHVETDNTNATGTVLQPAVQLAAGVAATIRSSIVSGRHCVDAPASASASRACQAGPVEPTGQPEDDPRGLARAEELAIRRGRQDHLHPVGERERDAELREGRAGRAHQQGLQPRPAEMHALRHGRQLHDPGAAWSEHRAVGG
jgi:hypothetical protein